MRRFPAWRRAAGAAVLISLASGVIAAAPETPTSAPEIRHRAAAESFREETTGLEFPAVADTFSKIMARRSRNALIGTSVSYENEYGSFADVYVYAADPEGRAVAAAQFAEALTDTLRNIEHMSDKSTLVVSVKKLPAVLPGLPETVHFSRFRIRVEDDVVVSHLMMFLYRGRIVKVRVSYPAEIESEEAAALAFERRVLALAGMLIPPAEDRPAPVPSNANQTAIER